MPEYRRILLDGAAVQVDRDGDELVAADGRGASDRGRQHLPPVDPSQDHRGPPQLPQPGRGVR